MGWLGVWGWAGGWTVGCSLGDGSEATRGLASGRPMCCAGFGSGLAGSLRADEPHSRIAIKNAVPLGRQVMAPAEDARPAAQIQNGRGRLCSARGCVANGATLGQGNNPIFGSARRQCPRCPCAACGGARARKLAFRCAVDNHDVVLGGKAGKSPLCALPQSVVFCGE